MTALAACPNCGTRLAPEPRPLTARQREVLEYVRRYSAKNGHAPTVWEIAKHFRLSSLSTAHEHLTHLVDKGWLTREPNGVRGLKVVA